MSYEQADIREYSWGHDQTFGATTVTHFIVGPKGKVGFVRDISVDVSTSLSGTLVPEVQIGFSSGDFTFGRYRLGTTASNGYNAGPHSASQEAITGNPPRALADFAGHVVLDGGPLTSQGIAGGTYGTQVPAGRIPASGWTITNVIQGVDSSHCRIYVNGLSAAPGGLSVGQTVTCQGILGGGTNANAKSTVSAVDTTNYQYFEVAQSFTGTYTGGGIAFLDVFVTLLAGTGTPAGGGYVRVKIQWVGPESP